MGVYPAVDLQTARERRDQARKLVAAGFGRGARPVLTPGSRLGDGLEDAGRVGAGSLAGCRLAAEAGRWPDDPL